MKCLVLLNGRWDIERYMIENVNIDDISVESIYKIYKRNLKYIVAVLWLQKFNLPFQSLWYENWKRKIKNYDEVILNTSNLNWKIASYIKKKNPNVRLIAWYWDTVGKRSYLVERYKSICEVWSFDKKDCERYGMHQNIQFYYPINVENKNIMYDAMFVGRDKGRMLLLKEICDLLEQSGLSVYTYIQRDKKEKGDPEKKILKPMEYKEVVNLIFQSKCIIDIPKEGQTGMTMRVLESLFYSKKLITTDKNMFETEFYNPANIFIWDHPSENSLRYFFSIPYEPVSNEILNKYTVESWVRNFG